MIEGFLSWLQLQGQSYHLQSLSLLSPSQSNITTLLYVVTFRRSWLFATAFLICEITASVDYFGIIDAFYESGMHGVYQMLYYMLSLLIWCSVTFKQIKGTQNKKLALSCCIMIIFLITLSMDRFINAHTETWLYADSPNIILLIHVLIIISLYKPRAIIDGVVDKLACAFSFLRNNYAFLYFWYTIKNWQTNKRLL